MEKTRNKIDSVRNARDRDGQHDDVDDDDDKYMSYSQNKTFTALMMEVVGTFETLV
jgi:hypothetical protein